MLGHAKLSTTADLYLHENAGLKKKAASKMNNIMYLNDKKKAKKDKAN
jgi:hypothetical protein